MHYERTGRCFYVTEEIVASDTVFEELEDEEHFWDTKLLLPEGLTRQQLQEEHWESLRAAGAVIPPPRHMNANGLGHGAHIMRNLVYSQTALLGPHLPGGHVNGACSSSFHGRQGHNPHVESTLFFPGDVGLYRPLPTPHTNRDGNYAHENDVSDLMHGLEEDAVATRAFRRHVNPEAIDEVIGRTSAQFNGCLHDDDTASESPDNFIKTFTNLSDLQRHSETSSDSLWPEGDDLDNHFDEAFHDDLEDLDEIIAQNIGSTFGGLTVTE